MPAAARPEMDLNGVKQATLVCLPCLFHWNLQRLLQHPRLLRPRQAEAQSHPSVGLEPPHLAQQLLVLQHFALKRGGVDLVQAKVVLEESKSLLLLLQEVRSGMILDFMRGPAGVDPPICGDA
eukprot:608904-Hanusia_phi.AAC.2